MSQKIDTQNNIAFSTCGKNKAQSASLSKFQKQKTFLTKNGIIGKDNGFESDAHSIFNFVKFRLELQHNGGKKDDDYIIEHISNMLQSSCKTIHHHHVDIPQKKMMPFQLMCLEQEKHLNLIIPQTVKKLVKHKICGYLWGKKVKLPDEAKNIIHKYALQPIPTHLKKKYYQRARKHNKKHKLASDKHKNKSSYIRMCNAKRPEIQKIEGIKNKDIMKIFSYLWKGTIPVSDELQNIIKDNGIKL